MSYDDLCVYGKSEKEHGSNLLKLMESASNNHLIFNTKMSHIMPPNHLLQHNL